MVYTVGEMAKILNIAPSTLRYYEKEGLLPFVERSGGGIRLFKDSDHEMLKVINCLKQTGMSLKEIKLFVQMIIEGDKTINDRLQLFLKQREAVKKQMEDLQKTLDILDFKCWYYETAKEAGTTEVLDNMTLEDIPEKFRKGKGQLKLSSDD